MPIISLSLLLLGFNLPLAAHAACPTYLTNLAITYVNVNPHQISCGGSVNITVGVFYPDGTPVTISPETMSFKFAGACSSLVIENVRVFPTGEPGFYSCNLTYTCSDQTATCTTRTTTTTCNPTTTGATTCYTLGTTTTCNQTCPFPTGTVKVSVLGCGISDAQGNFGPTDDTSSDLTLRLDENSILEVSTPITSTTTQLPPAAGMLSTYAVPAIILILLIVAAVLLLLKRMRGKQS